jgi:hypothetical protein
MVSIRESHKLYIFGPRPGFQASKPIIIGLLRCNFSGFLRRLHKMLQARFQKTNFDPKSYRILSYAPINTVLVRSHRYKPKHDKQAADRWFPDSTGIGFLGTNSQWRGRGGGDTSIGGGTTENPVF